MSCSSSVPKPLQASFTMPVRGMTGFGAVFMLYDKFSRDVPGEQSLLSKEIV